MTENKQFKLQTDIVGNCFIAGEDCTFGMFTKLERKQVIGVINKMNELYEEKESWRKSWIEEMGDQEEQSKCILKLVKENEQLKSIIDKLTLDNTKMKKVLNTTKNENEQIKHLIKEAYHNERTKLGQSVLKQLMEAIQ